MKLLTKRMPMDFNLFLFSDIHNGSEGFWKPGFEKLITMMNEEYDGLPVSRNFAVNHGDDIDGITYEDKRYNPDTAREDDMIIQAQETVQLLTPIKDRLIVILDGNHTKSLRRFANMGKFIAGELGVPFGTYTCKITYKSHKGKVLFKHYATHGYGSMNSTAYPLKRRFLNMQLALRRALENKSGDSYLNTMGHTHKLLVCEPDDFLFITDNGDNLEEWYIHQFKADQAARFIPPDFRWYGNTGTFLRTYLDDVSGYGEIRGYDPIPLGFLVARIRDGRMIDLKVQRV